MEVAHRDDHVTSAVLGGGEKIEAAIVNDPLFMQMLSANLYSDQILAVVREVICNADDAHKEHGVDRPFIVTLDNEKFEVKDFGPGIPHDKMGEIYLTYGKSTKKNSGIATGGFGLGCKSPFAYTDSFQVISCNKGVKTIYRLSKSDAEVGGAPSCIKIVSMPTTETGLTVTINMKSGYDKSQFAVRTSAVLFNGGMKAEYNGNPAKAIDYSKATDGYLIIPEQIGHHNDGIMIKYGAVLYPLNRMDEYKVAFEKARSYLRYYPGSNRTLILMAPPDSISLTPSREEMSMQKESIETVTALLNAFNKSFGTGYAKYQVKMHKGVIEQAIKEQEWGIVLGPRYKNRGLFDRYQELENPDGNITSARDLAAVMLSHEFPQHVDAYKDGISRLLGAAAHGHPQRGECLVLARTLQKANKKSRYADKNDCMRRWFQQRMCLPLLNIINEMTPTPVKGKKYLGAKYLTHKRLYVVQGGANIHQEDRYYNTCYAYPAVGYTSQYSNLATIHMINKRLILCHDSDGIGRRANGYMPDPNGSMLYEVQRSKTANDEATEMAKRAEAMGWKVFDLRETMDYKAPRAPKAATATKAKTGLPTLSGIYRVYSGDEKIFDIHEATRTDSRVAKPKAVTQVFSRSSYRGREKLPNINSAEEAKIIEFLWGKEIGVVRSDTQQEMYMKKGIPLLYIFVMRKLKEFYDKPENLATLKWNGAGLLAYCDEQNVNMHVVNLFGLNAALIKASGWKESHMTAEQLKHYKLLKGFIKTYGLTEEARHEDLLENQGRDLYPLMQAMQQVEPPAHVRKLVSKLKGNVPLSILDPSSVRDLLKGGKPEEIEQVTKILIKGLKG